MGMFTKIIIGSVVTHYAIQGIDKVATKCKAKYEEYKANKVDSVDEPTQDGNI